MDPGAFAQCVFESAPAYRRFLADAGFAAPGSLERSPVTGKVRRLDDRWVEEK